MQRETIAQAAGGPGGAAGMVPGVKAGGFIFLSAIRGTYPGRNQPMSDDTKEQARQAFENIKSVLEASGGSLQHVVKVVLYLHDLKYRTPFHEVWMQYFPENPPARIAIRVADANAQEGGNAHFALDVIALAP